MIQPVNTSPPAGDLQWRRLGEADPVAIVRITGAAYDPAGFFTVSFMTFVIRVYPALRRIESEGAAWLATSHSLMMVVLTYLLMEYRLAPQHRWVSEKELMGGGFFFKGPHALTAESLIRCYGAAPRKFIEDCRRLGGEPLPGFGDAAMRFEVLPGIPMALVLWAEDDEFPARITFLFDATIDRMLALDIILPMVNTVVKVIERSVSD
jgi:hypothetical protein